MDKTNLPKPTDLSQEANGEVLWKSIMIGIIVGGGRINNFRVPLFGLGYCAYLLEDYREQEAQ